MDLSKLARFTFGAGLIGLLVLPSTEVDGGISSTCGGCMVLSLWSTFSPAQTRARRDVRFAQAHRLSELARQVKREPKHNSRHAERCSRLYAGDT